MSLHRALMGPFLLITSFLLIAPLLLLTPPLFAGTLPSTQQLEEQLSELSGRDSLSQNQSRDRAALEAAIKFRRELERNGQALEALNQRLPRVAGELASIEQELRNHSAPDSDADLRAGYEEKDIRALVATLTGLINSLEQQQSELAEVSSTLINYQTLPERVQATLSRDLSRAEDIRRQLSQSEFSGTSLSSIERDALRIELAAINSRADLSRRELWSTDQLQSLAERKKLLLERRIVDTEYRLGIVQESLNNKRRARTEQLIEAAIREIPESLANTPLLLEQLKRNRQVGEQLLLATENTNRLIRENIGVETNLERSRQTLRNLNEQIQLLQGSLLLSQIIYSQQETLTQTILVDNLEQRIADLRFEQFRLREVRDELRNPEKAAQRMLEQRRETASEDVYQALVQILQIRADLTEQLERETSRQLNLAIGIDLNQQQLQAIHRSLRATIQEQSFWMPSNRAINRDWLLSIPLEIPRQIAALPWRAVGSELSMGFRSNLWVLTPFIVIAGLLAVRRQRIKYALKLLEKGIGLRERDSQLHTPMALLYSLLLDAPIPLLLGGAGLALLGTDGLYLQVCALVLLRASALWLVIAVCHRLLAPGGISETHFDWPAARATLLRRRIFAIGGLLLLLLPVTSSGSQWPELLSEDRLGFSIFIGANFMLAIILYSLASAWRVHDQKVGVQRTLGLALAAIPVVLILLTLSGYYYSAIKLSGLLIESFYLIVLWIVLQASAIRGLAVAAQKLAFKRLLEEYRAKSELRERDAGADGAEIIEEPKLDVEKVNQQSLRLTRMALLVGFGSIFYFIWSELLGTFSYMDSFVVWESISGSGDALQVSQTSLGDLMTVLLIILVAFILARNLPGLLEVVLLSRMTLAPGTSYAITTLMNYIIFSIALVTSLSSLGFAWEKLQWLVAALGVGLGFGLQEIFANFVSGVIILFEKPVRIGDTITIGELSGTVSKIRIRATTIIDFDRKEIIVPNKAFVTERLVNWTLTDPVTRITIKVGFAYGSDLDLARRLLLQAAGENERVMKDPEPTVFFLSFGESTLDHEMRVHVRELTDRLRATDELNRRIDALCKEHNLEIAFNQLDVHLHSSNGDSACVDNAQGTSE